jgi:hypothetical protein
MGLSCCGRANVPPGAHVVTVTRVATDAIPLEFRLEPTGDEVLDQILRKRRIVPPQIFLNHAQCLVEPNLFALRGSPCFVTV